MSTGEALGGTNTVNARCRTNLALSSSNLKRSLGAVDASGDINWGTRVASECAGSAGINTDSCKSVHTTVEITFVLSLGIAFPAVESTRTACSIDLGVASSAGYATILGETAVQTVRIDAFGALVVSQSVSGVA